MKEETEEITGRGRDSPNQTTPGRRSWVLHLGQMGRSWMGIWGMGMEMSEMSAPVRRACCFVVVVVVARAVSVVVSEMEGRARAGTIGSVKSFLRV